MLTARQLVAFTTAVILISYLPCRVAEDPAGPSTDWGSSERSKQPQAG